MKLDVLIIYCISNDSGISVNRLYSVKLKISSATFVQASAGIGADGVKNYFVFVTSY